MAASVGAAPGRASARPEVSTSSGVIQKKPARPCRRRSPRSVAEPAIVRSVRHFEHWVYRARSCFSAPPDGVAIHPLQRRNRGDARGADSNRRNVVRACIFSEQRQLNRRGRLRRGQEFSCGSGEYCATSQDHPPPKWQSGGLFATPLALPGPLAGADAISAPRPHSRERRRASWR